MKTRTIPIALAVLLCSAASPVWAAQDMAGMHQTHGNASIQLDSVTQDGVAARAVLHDVREMMAKSGRPETHHMMVMFTDAASGTPLTEGSVAVKVTPPGGVKGEAAKMMVMGDGFGADVTVATPGPYSFEVGSKLADGKRRVFVFNHTK